MSCANHLKWFLNWLPRAIGATAALLATFAVSDGVKQWSSNINANANNNQVTVNQILSKMSPPFALVSPEGNIIYQSRLQNYDPQVVLENFENGKKYIIEFSKPPKAVVFISQDAAVTKKLKSNGKIFEVAFYEGTGRAFGGGMVIKSEFIMQVFEP